MQLPSKVWEFMITLRYRCDALNFISVPLFIYAIKFIYVISINELFLNSQLFACLPSAEHASLCDILHLTKGLSI